MAAHGMEGADVLCAMGARLLWCPGQCAAAEELLQQNQLLFVEQHEHSLSLEEAKALKHAVPCAAAKRRLIAISARLTPKSTVRNRRLAELKRLEAEGFFSIAEIKERSTDLYRLYISSTEEESEAEQIRALRQELLGTEGVEALRLKRPTPAPAPAPETAPPQQQRRGLFGAMHSDDSDSDDNGAGSFMTALPLEEPAPCKPVQRQQVRDVQMEMSDGAPLPAKGGGYAWGAREQLEKEEELIDLMKSMFVCGRDAHVDYAAIDTNEQLDDVALHTQDMEDGYFAESDGALPLPHASFAQNAARFALAAREPQDVDRSEANGFGF